MKYIRKTSYNIKEDFTKNLLIDRNILNKNDQTYIDKFFNPSLDNECYPESLDNIEEGYELLMKHLMLENKILICIDPDVDGYTSAAILYNYLNDVMKTYFNFSLEYHVPEGKEHGLRTLMELFDTYERKYDLIIMPDSSSNDYEQHKILKEKGYDILVIDHHLCEKYSENAIVINNQLSTNYKNKDLSGVGVVYKFLEYIDYHFKTDENLNLQQHFSKNYLDLVALGEISDMMNMTSLENRFICDYGLSNIKNKFFKELIEKQAYSLGEGDLTQIGVAFYITPLINALIRVGSQTEKERLFQAFISPDVVVPSTKRGEKGQFETVSTQSVRNCVNAKSRQNREKEKALELLDVQIIENCLENNKILILNADELNTPNTLTGLCAMGVSAKYKKPVILGRISPDGYLKGSGRGRNESELKDFRQFLINSNLIDFAEGHAQAFGTSIKISNIEKLNEYANEKLKNINFNEGFYEADFVVNGNCSYLNNLVRDLGTNSKFWGQSCDEPVVIVENISLPKNEIKIIGKNKDTLKFTFNDMTYVKFKASDLIKKINESCSSKILIDIAGRCNINPWGGRITPQILIDEIEIKDENKYDF